MPLFFRVFVVIEYANKTSYIYNYFFIFIQSTSPHPGSLILEQHLGGGSVVELGGSKRLSHLHSIIREAVISGAVIGQQ